MYILGAKVLGGGSVWMQMSALLALGCSGWTCLSFRCSGQDLKFLPLGFVTLAWLSRTLNLWSQVVLDLETKQSGT